VPLKLQPEEPGIAGRVCPGWMVDARQERDRFVCSCPTLIVTEHSDVDGLWQISLHTGFLRIRGPGESDLALIRGDREDLACCCLLEDVG
jgi:hypothetical protein